MRHGCGLDRNLRGAVRPRRSDCGPLPCGRLTAAKLVGADKLNHGCTGYCGRSIPTRRRGVADTPTATDLVGFRRATDLTAVRPVALS